MVAAAAAAHGGLDIVVCAAGITSRSRISALSEDEFDRVIGVNLKGMYTIIHAALPRLRERGGGTIVTVGSEMGFVADPNAPAYNASKGGVIMFTKSIAIDLIRDNIRVRSVRAHVEGDDIGYIRITTFNEQTTEGLKREIGNLTTQIVTTASAGVEVGGSISDSVVLAGGLDPGNEVEHERGELLGPLECQHVGDAGPDDEPCLRSLGGDPLCRRANGRLVAIADDDKDRAGELRQAAGRGRRQLVLGCGLLVPFRQLERLALHPPDERANGRVDGIGRPVRPVHPGPEVDLDGAVHVAVIERFDLRGPDRSQLHRRFTEECPARRGEHERIDG